MHTEISFPNLGIYLKNVGKSIDLFGIEIAYYGIIIGTAILLGFWIAAREAKRTGQNPENYLDMGIIGVIAGIVGARLYYVIFSWNTLYRYDPMEAFNIREGGLAIHGGLIFGLVTAWAICRKKNIPFLSMADLILPGVALAQCIGRWGNFFNSEAYGRPTNLPWAIVVNGQHVHPTFLYESVWCGLLCLFLLYVDNRHRRFSGQIMCLYGILYSAERFFVESLRTDSLMLGPFRQAMVLSAFVFVGSVILYIFLKRREEN